MARHRWRGNPHGDRPSDEIARTCPQFFARSPFVQSVMEDLDDYCDGRLDISDISAAQLTYLRIARLERQNWANHEDARLMPKVKRHG